MALRGASYKVSLLGVPFRVWVQGHQFSYQYTQPSSYYIANVRISTGQIAPKATRCSGGACSLEVLTDIERDCPEGQISPNQRSRRPLASAHDASRMAPDVEKAFVSLFRDKAGVSEQDVEAWMEGLKDSRRYLVDVWPRTSEHLAAEGHMSVAPSFSRF